MVYGEESPLLVSPPGNFSYDMATSSSIQQLLPDGYVWAPGTVVLADHHEPSSKAVLFPIPTEDPDDPLNWSSRRKFVNYSIVCSYVLWTFVQLDVGLTAWGPLMDELGISQFALNASVAANYAGLAFGCLVFIPFLYRYGRRPIYLFSVALQLGSCIYQGLVQNNTDIIVSNLLSGLGGAISETVVQITIADVFFVHQHAEMNAWYLIMTAVGAFLGPVASGYITDSQGWRWVWWYCTIFLSIQFVVSIFAFEESKYIPNFRRSSSQAPTVVADYGSTEDIPKQRTQRRGSVLNRLRPQLLRTKSQTDPTITKKTYRQRMAFTTTTNAPVVRHFWQPVVVLFTFPAILYTAVTFGIILASFAAETTIQATYLLEPPYNFSASGVGLMNLPPFVGAILGFPFGGYLNDKSIRWSASRNQGIYEPEMRLWMVLPFALLIPGGILMFGLGLAYVSLHNHHKPHKHKLTHNHTGRPLVPPRHRLWRLGLRLHNLLRRRPSLLHRLLPRRKSPSPPHPFTIP